MTCSFFGHADTPSGVRVILKETIADLIENRGADLFYVGNHGGFDRMAVSVLKELRELYPRIQCNIVLAYLPTEESELPTVFPEGIEFVPKRFAINFRNKYMVERADIVVAYVNRSYGGAVKFVDMARKKGKEIINLAQP